MLRRMRRRPLASVGYRLDLWPLPHVPRIRASTHFPATGPKRVLADVAAGLVGLILVVIVAVAVVVFFSA